MSSWGSKDAQIHVANGLGCDLTVLVTPNPDWVWADLAAMVVTTVVITAATAGSGTAATAGAEATQSSSALRLLQCADDIVGQLLELKSLQDLRYIKEAAEAWEIVSNMQQVYEAVEAVKSVTINERQIETASRQIKSFFDDKPSIAAGEFERVAEDNFLTPFRALEPSYWGAISGASTAHLTLVSESLELFTSFNSDPDHSWIATPQGVVRAKYGTVWTPDPGAGSHAWNLGSRRGLPGGRELKAGVPFYSHNGRYRLVLREDGDLVIEDGRTFEAIWQSGTRGRGATRLKCQWDGRLTLSTESGEVVWESPVRSPPDSDIPPTHRAGLNTEFVRRMARAELRDDGELAVKCALAPTPRGAPPEFWQRPDREYLQDLERATGTNEWLDWEFPAWSNGVHRAPRTTLRVGETLPIGEELQSSNLEHRLVFQPDGDLVLLKSDGAIVWNTGTADRCASRARLLDDGSFVVCTLTDEVLWSSQSLGSPTGPEYAGARIELQPDGNLCAYDREDRPFWDTLHHPRLIVTIRRNEPREPAMPEEMRRMLEQPGVPEQAKENARRWFENTLAAYREDLANYRAELEARKPQPGLSGRHYLKMNEFLTPGATLRSKNGQYTLTWYPSGVMELTRGVDALWRTAPYERPARLTLQDDGNLVATDTDGAARWAANRDGGRCGPEYRGSILVLHDDGELAVHSPWGHVAWSSRDSAGAIAEPLVLNATPVGQTLLAGQQLLPDQCLMSLDGLYRLSYLGDGNLVLHRSDGRVLWTSKTSRRPASRVTLLDDGDLVIEGRPGAVVWAAHEHGGRRGREFAHSHLALQNDGNAVVTAEDGTVLWASNTSQGPVAESRGERLRANEELAPEQWLQSGNGRYKLRYQADGNLVLYRVDDDNRVVWKTDTVGRSAGRVLLADDGALRVRDAAGEDIWNSLDRHGQVAMRGEVHTLTLHDDGNLVVRSGGGTILWSSNTSDAPPPPPPPVVAPVPSAPPPPPAISLGSALGEGQVIERTQWLQSNDGRFKLAPGEHGRDLVITETNGRVVWRAGFMFPSWRVTLERGGDLIVQDADDSVRWRTSQNGGRRFEAGGTRAVLRDDGVLVVQAPDRTLLWASDPNLLSLPSDLGAATNVLLPGQSLRSNTGDFTLTYRLDGDLVLTGGGRTLWSTNSAGTEAGRVAVQPDGSFTVCAPGGAVLWNSVEHGGLAAAHYTNGRLWLRDDGRLFVQTGNGFTWSSDPDEVSPPGSRGSSLRTGQSLAAGQWLESADGQCALVFRADGSFTLRRDGREAWYANISGGWPWRVVLQDDAELVVRDRAGVNLWRSNDRGGRSGPQYAGSTLELKDGAAVIRAPDGTLLWATNDAHLPKGPKTNVGSRLRGGRVLGPDEQLNSDTWDFNLSIRSDGDLVLAARDGTVRWQANTRGANVRAYLNGGELLVVNAGPTGNEVLWNSAQHGGRAGSSGDFDLVVRDDGALVVESRSSPMVAWPWSSNPAYLSPPRASRGAVLRVGETLGFEQSLQSANLEYTFDFDERGIRVRHTAGTWLWSSPLPENIAFNRALWRVVLQEDGDLVLTAGPGNVLWRASEHGGKRGPQYAWSSVTLQDDGALVVRAPNGEVVWSVNEVPPAVRVGVGAVIRGESQFGPSLAPGQWVGSMNGRYKLLYRPDGNLVLLKDDARVLWESGTAGRPVGRVRLKDNGDLRIVAAQGAQALWSSAEHGGQTRNSTSSRAELEVLNNGNVVVTAFGDRVWQTDTVQPRTELLPGEGLRPDQEGIVSPNKKFGLYFISEGRLAVNGPGGPLWTSPTAQPGTSDDSRIPYGVELRDGALRITYRSGRVWTTVEDGGKSGPEFATARAELRDDGNLVIVTPSGLIAWMTDTHAWDYSSVTATLPDGCLGATLREGQALVPGQFLQSPNGVYRLFCRFDGNAAVCNYLGSSERLFRTQIKGATPGRLVVQGDGTLALFSGAGGAPIWFNNPTEYKGLYGPQYAGSSLTLRDSGALVLTAPDGAVLWSSDMNDVPPACNHGSSVASVYMRQGQWLQSPDGRYKLAVRQDGTFALTASDGAVLWQADTPGRAVNVVEFRADGRLRLGNRNGGEFWASADHGFGNSAEYRLCVEDDGKARIRHPRYGALWQVP